MTKRTDRERYVGLFYFLWLGQHGTEGPFDNTKILKAAPEAVFDPNHPSWGPQNAFHFWGEPLYGYYLSDDAWVLRKHVQLLTAAGVDFLVFDTTNAVTYKNVYDVLFGILDDVRRQGFDVPRIAFYTNTRSGETIAELYEDIYKPGRYPELWFHWKGKPLIIGDPEQCDAEMREFFTFRLNQWPFEERKTNGFPWIEFCRPQRVYYNDEGEKEVISVSVAQHPTVAMSDTPFYNHGLNWGRSFHNGVNDESPGAEFAGHNIAEQWKFALAEDPLIVFITGWNEWIAMRLQGPPERPILFVDQATLNFSRDIEPMNGGYNDEYYLQMVDAIRRFKGLPPPTAAGPGRTIPMEQDFRGWDDVVPEYRDFAGDTMPRRHRGYGNLLYTDDTGRNDFVSMKATHDEAHIYFYARTREAITPHTGRHWMMLLIDTGGSSDEGWHGYDYIVNRTIKDASRSVLEHSVRGWQWEPVCDIRYVVRGNELQLAVPRAALGLDRSGTPLRFEFKWVDYMQNEGDFMDFYRHGDVAPEGRLKFVYREPGPDGE
ncbi:hypothetical protein [Paenibacillus sp.]|uniref:hypothetical protein n=1 Tax=Paenibacillus sp. TaxID=58172 RepID=UPI002D4B20F4|nr:hypothetical protein [Paenibacillus sp.]HZG58871.1 hypothetical protein [Paenibacillus sp.]